MNVLRLKPCKQYQKFTINIVILSAIKLHVEIAASCRYRMLHLSRKKKYIYIYIYDNN